MQSRSSTVDTDEHIAQLLAQVPMPKWNPASPAEKARRRRLAEEALEIRNEIGPIDIRAEELLRLAEMESET